MVITAAQIVAIYLICVGLIGLGVLKWLHV